MPYYVLQRGYELCGFKGLPFALRHPNPVYTDFYDRERFRVVYACDGRHDIREDELTEAQKNLLKQLVEQKIAIPSDGTRRLEPNQEYRSYPAMYKSQVQWSVTGRCNYRCRHCFMSAPDYKGGDLTLGQCLHILDELAACGIRSVDLTGGEPLVIPHIFELLDGMRERNIVLGTIYTNGALVNERLLVELEKRQMKPVFQMSFDGVRWHDWMRGIPGAEETVIRKFRFLNERGYGTETAMCLHRHNIGDLKENIDLLASLGVSHLKMGIADPLGSWKSQRGHFLTADEANEAFLAYIPQYVADGMPMSVQFGRLIEFNTKRRMITIPLEKFSGREKASEGWACSTIKNTMYISPQGRILPCMMFAGTVMDGPPFDSVLEKPLSEILSNSFYRNTCLTKMGDCIGHNEKCRGCEYRLVCGAGCRYSACGELGTDYLAPDEETCCLFRNGWYEKAKELRSRYRKSFPAEKQKP